MRILVLGADGYLGWPTCMHFANRGHEVCAVDNYYRRLIADQTDSNALVTNPLLPERCEIFENEFGKQIDCRIGDLSNLEFVLELFADVRPDIVIHYAEQPSAPYSMIGPKEAQSTFNNNLGVTFNVIWGMIEHCPDAHLIKLGTMGEYGTPNIDIEEGWINIEHKGRTDKFLFPRAAGSLYHTTKVLDTDLLWFYVRLYNLKVTDLMQGPVYGLETNETRINENLMPNFHYDDLFGTVVNRFLIQAIAGIPLTVYGKGGQTRGYLNLKDTLQCVELAALNSPASGELKIYNQLTETFTVNALAEKIKLAGENIGLAVEIKNIENPRKEKENHYYNPASTGLIDLGLKPHLLTEDVVEGMLRYLSEKKQNIKVRRILPRVKWS
jgi:UDP-sulfoquinovose synthase